MSEGPTFYSGSVANDEYTQSMVLAERERCAKIAEYYSEGWAWDRFANNANEGVHLAAIIIAKRIRMVEDK